jgi:hypothetical protein
VNIDAYSISRVVNIKLISESLLPIFLQANRLASMEQLDNWCIVAPVDYTF